MYYSNLETFWDAIPSILIVDASIIQTTTRTEDINWNSCTKGFEDINSSSEYIKRVNIWTHKVVCSDNGFNVFGTIWFHLLLWCFPLVLPGREVYEKRITGCERKLHVTRRREGEGQNCHSIFSININMHF